MEELGKKVRGHLKHYDSFIMMENKHVHSKFPRNQGFFQDALSLAKVLVIEMTWQWQTKGQSMGR